jgi:hypothetical protein
MPRWDPRLISSFVDVVRARDARRIDALIG